MKELLIISGKGGTGKTSITAAFAALADNKVIADCDVDAADMHLLLQPDVKETHQFYASKVAEIHEDKCVRCGKCIEACRFDAIEDFKINHIYCEGCGVCYRICPQNAITMEDSLSGHWFVSETKHGPMVHAKLGIAEENSGKLVTEVRKAAQKIAQEQNKSLIIIDGPPGIGCPVISSITGVDMVLIVTEPTVAGKHDLERIIKLANHFDVKTAVCINKYDLDERKTLEIENYCKSIGVDVISKIPFDRKVIDALIKGLSIVEYEETSQTASEIKNLWQKVQNML
ncbi:MAG: hypothetical protein PWQ82_542 [Thermosediminibacterales bacterium]|nr:hypothetical protein [Thermosediminibacterales bacterium]MDK2835956.1 hypothetical protein [Thermosediminibacterales bacterium]